MIVCETMTRTLCRTIRDRDYVVPVVGGTVLGADTTSHQRYGNTQRTPLIEHLTENVREYEVGCTENQSLERWMIPAQASGALALRSELLPLNPFRSGVDVYLNALPPSTRSFTAPIYEEIQHHLQMTRPQVCQVQYSLADSTSNSMYTVR